MQLDPAQTRDIELFQQWLDSIEVEEPGPPPKPVCGQCENYQHPKPGMWGYCRLRAEADVHPCNLPPWDSYAEQCHFFSQEVPF